MSYARVDDDHYDAQISEFGKLLSAEVRMQTGREFTIFQDREHIPWGENWQEVIDKALDSVALLLVIITPGLFASDPCRSEVTRFRQRERELGRSDLILPVYYVSAREMEDPALRRDDPIATVLASRQYVDWRRLRLESVDSLMVRKAIADLATRMATSFWQAPPPSSRPPGRQRPTGSATASAPFGMLTGGPGVQYQPWPSAGQSLPGASGAPPAQSQPPVPSAPRIRPMPYVPPESFLAPAPPESRTPPAPYARAASPSGPAVPPQWARFQAPWPSPDTRAPGLRGLLSWPPRRRTMLAGGALAVLALAGVLYAVIAPGSPSAGPTVATLAATLTVPGGGTVDTVWISPDGKEIAAARTAEASTIYIWKTADRGTPLRLAVPRIKIGTKDYPASIENLAFSADDTSLTAIEYPTATGSNTVQSYVLYQWNLATGAGAVPWSLVRTASNLSFSHDNGTAVEPGNGGAKLVPLLPKASPPSPLAIPGASGLTVTTSFDLDYNGKRMLYSPTRGAYTVWDFATGQKVDGWTGAGRAYLSPDGKTALVFFYGADTTTLTEAPLLRDLATKANVTPLDSRWANQLVSSSMEDQFVTYSTDGTVITTERAGGQTDLWSDESHKFLLTITDKDYRDDSSYVVVGPRGGEVVIFGGKAGGYEYRRLYVWNTGLR